MKNALKIVEFMKTVEQLCLVERDNLMSSGRQETDADHIFKLAFLVLMIHPYLKSRPIVPKCWNWRWFMIWLKPAPAIILFRRRRRAPN